MDKVLLINMPISGILSPPLGVSLLKSGLKKRGIDSDIFYANIIFAKLVGENLYNEIALRRDGDIIFSEYFWDIPIDTYKKELENIIGQNCLDKYLYCSKLVPEFMQACFQSVDWHKYKVIGFSSSYAQSLASLALAQKIRSNYPHLKIIFGGSNCVGVSGKTLHTKFPFIDIVFQGESDIIFPEVIKRLFNGKGLKGIPNIVTRNINIDEGEEIELSRKISLDDLPFPDFDDWAIQLKKNNFRVNIAMEGSRGCWWNKCTFCNTVNLPGNNIFNYKSIQRILDEFRYLNNKYNPDRIQFTDVVINMKFFEDLLQNLLKNRFRAKIGYEIRANLNKSQCLQLKKANFDWVQIGIESFSQIVLDKMKKGSEVLQNIQILKWCNEIGIQSIYNLLYGFPDEVLDDYQEIIEIIPKICHFRPPGGFSPVIISRYSSLYELLDKEKLRPLPIYQYIYRFPEDEILNLVDFFYSTDLEENNKRLYNLLYPYINNWRYNYWKVNKYNHLLMKDFGLLILIYDSRQISKKRIYIFGGKKRNLYLACDAIIKKDELYKKLGYKSTSARTKRFIKTEKYLNDFCDKNLMLQKDLNYLSLAISPKNVLVKILYLLMPFFFKFGPKIESFIKFKK